jgi:hypothetical protein
MTALDPNGTTGVCDVCATLDDDWSPKFVKWCSFCKAWLCAPCSRDWGRRARAAASRFWRR